MTTRLARGRAASIVGAMRRVAWRLLYAFLFLGLLFNADAQARAMTSGVASGHAAMPAMEPACPGMGDAMSDSSGGTEHRSQAPHACCETGGCHCAAAHAIVFFSGAAASSAASPTTIDLPPRSRYASPVLAGPGRPPDA